MTLRLRKNCPLNKSKVCVRTSLLKTTQKLIESSHNLEGASVPGELFSQHFKLQQMLEESIRKKQKETDERIEQYRQEQQARLEREISKVKYDQQLLWQRMLEALRTVHEEEEREKRVPRIQMRSDVREEREGGSTAAADDKLPKSRPITVGSMPRGSVRFFEESIKDASSLSVSLSSKPSKQPLEDTTDLHASEAADDSRLLRSPLSLLLR